MTAVTLFNPDDAPALHTKRAGRVGRACMFSRENRPLLIIFCAITAVALGTIAGACYLIQHDKQAAAVWTGSGVLVTYLLGFARAELRAREATTGRIAIADKVDEIERKTNGNLTRAIEHVAEKVRQAKDQPAPGQEAMPRTPAELQSLLKLFAKSICDDLAREAAAEAARRVAEQVDSVVKDAAGKAAIVAGEVAARAVVEEMRRAGMTPPDGMDK